MPTFEVKFVSFQVIHHPDYEANPEAAIYALDTDGRLWGALTGVRPLKWKLINGPSEEVT